MKVIPFEPELQSVMNAYAKDIVMREFSHTNNANNAEWSQRVMSHGKTTDVYQKTESAIRGSPLLLERLSYATKEGVVHTIRFDKNAPSTGYSAYFQPSDRSISVGDFSCSRKLAGYLGHELKHAFNNAHIETDESETFDKKALRIRNDVANQTLRDYTEPLRTYVEAIKTDEATAEIEGWNTHVDYMKSKPDIKPDGSKVEPTLLNIAKAYSNAHLLFEDDGWRFSGNEPKFKLELKGQNNAEYMLDGGRQDTVHGMGELFFENNGQFCQDNNIQLDAALNYRNRVAVSGLDIILSIENSLPRNSNETVVINMKDLGIDAEKNIKSWMVKL